MKLKTIVFISIALFLFPALHATQVNTTLPIKKVILWGHKLHSHTHSYIHWAFMRAFEHLGFETYWLDNSDDVSNFDFSGSLFITEGQVDQNIPIRTDCFYILHNCDGSRYKELYQAGRAITLQVYTHDCLDYNLTKIDECMYCDVSSSLIHLPWATDLLPDEIEENKKNIVTQKKNEFVYVGSVWGGEFGNVEQVYRFRKAASENNIKYHLAKNCSMEANIDMVRHAYMAPSLQGEWQVRKGYIPCRIFKNISYGAFGITNSETVYQLFHEKIVYNPDEYQLFYDAKEKLDHLDIQELYELMNFVKEKHTYINRIQTLLSFLETVYASKNS